MVGAWQGGVLAGVGPGGVRQGGLRWVRVELGWDSEAGRGWTGQAGVVRRRVGLCGVGGVGLGWGRKGEIVQVECCEYCAQSSKFLEVLQKGLFNSL